MKSKGTAYLLLFFGGVFGLHQFYLGNTGKGFLYLFTFGLLGVGVIMDLFSLGQQVDNVNMKYMMLQKGQTHNQQSINVNITDLKGNESQNPSHQNKISAADELEKFSKLMDQGKITREEFEFKKKELMSGK